MTSDATSRASDELRLFPLPPPVITLTGDVDAEELWGYFIATSNGGRVKHGITKRVDDRKRSLQTANAERLVLTGAYPTYSPELERAIGAHFNNHRAGGGNEWFEPWTVEFKITALGGGIPPSIFDAYAEAREERRRLLAGGSARSIQARITELQRSGDLGRLREPERIAVNVLQSIAEQSPFEAMLPLSVQVEQLWTRRLSGELPFDLSTAELRAAHVDLSQMRLRER